MGPVDVIVAFYRQGALWPLVAKGLRDNQECINRVLVVNDEPWPPGWIMEGPTEDVTKTVLLDHPHKADTAVLCIRQGLAAVTTEYACYIDGDVVLHKGSIREMLRDAAPERLLGGLIHSIPKNTPLDQIACPEEVVPDHRIGQTVPNIGRVRGGFFMCRPEDYFAAGGHDPAWPGYGCWDWDLNMRWMRHFGLRSLMVGEGQAYHLGIKKTRKRTKECNALFQERHAAFKVWEEKYGG